jgi:hypothetical protein
MSSSILQDINLYYIRQFDNSQPLVITTSKYTKKQWLPYIIPYIHVFIFPYTMQHNIPT